jgi:hypothetical protein
MAGGRPKADTDTRRDCVVSFRLSASELADLEARAAAAGEDRADYGRRVLVASEAPRRRRRVAGSSPVFTPDELAALNRIGGELRSIGVNVNQLARVVNYGTGDPIHADLAAELRELPPLRGKLDALFSRFLP